LLSQTVEDYEIVVVDDCSTDRTPGIVQDLMRRIPQIRYFRNTRNLNVGLSFRRAVACAEKEFLFWQTVDWAYDISLLRAHLEFLRTHDVVAGVRRSPVQAADRYLKPFMGLFKLLHIKHLTRRSDTLGKAVISVVNYMLIRVLFQLPLSDYQNVCFLRTRLIQSIHYESRSSFANPEGLLKAYWKGASIVEVPISFLPRQKGEAKGTRAKAVLNSVWDILRLWCRWVVLRRREFVRKGTITRLRPQDWEGADS
jgi:glycosyltransferase involved in cell wall biosynthesis